MYAPAHRILVSYSHDSEEHRQLVRRLADSLRENGFEVSFDQYLPEDPLEGWPLWSMKEIDLANKVLIVCTETYLRRFLKAEEPEKGNGVGWEAHLICIELFRSAAKTNKYIPVLLRESDRRFVPMPLGASRSFLIEDAAGFEKLFFYLHGQANQPAPPIGAVQNLEVPQPLPTFKMKAIAAPPVASPSPTILIRSLKPNTAPPSRFELRQLDWYEEADADFFRGREADVKSLRSLLLDQPVVRLFGSSGVGKSSLLRAGLVPELRRHGFRSVVVRPFKNPEETIPQQISEQLLSADSPSLSLKLTLENLQAELGPAFVAEQCPYLFVLIDQVEDVVSPLVPLEARERLVSFLQQVWNAGSMSRPLIRALVVYRTDADARLGSLWQEVSGAAAGLPYHAIHGLTRDMARRVLSDALAQSSQPHAVLKPETLAEDERPQTFASDSGFNVIDDLIAQLVRESLSLDASSDVFPPYLQMILAQLADTSASSTSTDKEPAADPVLKLASAGDLIGTYMRSRLAQLESRGGDFTKCRAVLEALSRSTGQKLTLTLGEIAAEVRLSRDAVQPLLDALMSSRLVRPVGESYEVQHDRLAETVIASLSDSDREFKAARELLAAKTVNHSRTGAWLTPSESHLLYCHHVRLNPSRSELQLILGSLLTADDQANPVAGWIFLERYSGSVTPIYGELARDKDRDVRQVAIRAIAQFQKPENLPLLRELACGKYLDVREAAVRAIAQFQQSEDLSLLRELARGKDRNVRLAAGQAIAQFQKPEDLPALRALARGQEWYVHRAAIRAIAEFHQAEALPLLLELARDKAVCKSAVEAIAQFHQPEDLPLLRELARDKDIVDVVRKAAVETIAQFHQPEDLPLMRELARDKDNFEVVRNAAVEALAQFHQSEDRPLLRELTRDKAVRKAAVEAIAQFHQPEDLPLMRELARNKDVFLAAVQAVAQFHQPEDLPLMRVFARDISRAFRQAALQAIGQFHQSEDLPLMRELARDRHYEVREAAVLAIARFDSPEALPLLRKLACDKAVHEVAVHAIVQFPPALALSMLREIARDKDVREMAVQAIAQFHQPDDLPLMRELARDKDKNKDIRKAAVEAIGQFQKTEDVPLLIELAHNTDLRYAVSQSIAQFQQPEALPLMRELARDKYANTDVRESAVQAIAQFHQAEDLPLLRELACGNSGGICLMAIRAIAQFQQAEDLPLLRELAVDMYVQASHEACQAIAQFHQPEALPLLRKLASDTNGDVRRAAVQAIAQFQGPEDLPLARELARDEDCGVRQAAIGGIWKNERRPTVEEWLLASAAELAIDVVARLDFLLYAPEWLRKTKANE